MKLGNKFRILGYLTVFSSIGFSSYAQHLNSHNFAASYNSAMEEIILGQAQAKKVLLDYSMTIISKTKTKTGANAMMLYGPSGVGKVTFFKSYAKSLGAPVYEVPVALISKNDSGPLLAELTKQIKANPRTVIVFKNYEMASGEVKGAILTILESNQIGFEQDAVKTSKAFFGITMTSGTELVEQWVSYRKQKPMMPVGYLNPTTREKIQSLPENFNAELAREIPFEQSRDALLKSGVDRALLAQVTTVAPAFPPSQEEFSQIFAKHFNESIVKMSREKGVRIEMTSDNLALMMNQLNEKLYHPTITHEEITMAVQKLVDESFIDAQNRGKLIKGETVVLSFYPEKTLLDISCSEHMKPGQGKAL